MNKISSYGEELNRIYSCYEYGPGNPHAFDITIQVTEACNLSCTYCYQHNKSSKRLSFETGKKFIDLILASDERTKNYISSRECPGVVLNFIGGEPLLEIELIDRLVDYFVIRCVELNHPWATRYRITMSTNGMLYFDEKVQSFMRKHSGHLGLSISIDGNKRLHDMCRIDKDGNGSFDRAKAAALHYKEVYGGEPGSKMTICPANVSYVSEALISYIEDGQTYINANCVYEKGWEVKHAKILYKELKFVADYLLDHNLQDRVYISILDDECGNAYPTERTWCGGTGDMLGLDTEGNIYPCIRYMPSSLGANVKPVILGTVDSGIATTKEEIDIINLFSNCTRKSQCIGTKCEDCTYASGCGDCAGYSYECLGELGKRTDYICDIHKARILASYYYKNKAHLMTGIKNAVRVVCPMEDAYSIVGESEYALICKLSDEALGSEVR